MSGPPLAVRQASSPVTLNQPTIYGQETGLNRWRERLLKRFHSLKSDSLSVYLAETEEADTHPQIEAILYILRRPIYGSINWNLIPAASRLWKDLTELRQEIDLTSPEPTEACPPLVSVPSSMKFKYQIDIADVKTGRHATQTTVAKILFVDAFNKCIIEQVSPNESRTAFARDCDTIHKKLGQYILQLPSNIREAFVKDWLIRIPQYNEDQEKASGSRIAQGLTENQLSPRLGAISHLLGRPAYGSLDWTPCQ